jgi:hypothetical protein
MAGMFKRSLQDAVTDAERASDDADVFSRLESSNAGGAKEKSHRHVKNGGEHRERDEAEAEAAGSRRRLPDRALGGFAGSAGGEGGGRKTRLAYIPGPEDDGGFERDMHPVMDRALGGGGGGGEPGGADGSRRRRSGKRRR